LFFSLWAGTRTPFQAVDAFIQSIYPLFETVNPTVQISYLPLQPVESAVYFTEKRRP
jgi:hypothetical protein